MGSRAIPVLNTAGEVPGLIFRGWRPGPSHVIGQVSGIAAELGATAGCLPTVRDSARRLSLTLLVPDILANDHNSAMTTNDLALVANLLNAWLNLHRDLSYLTPLAGHLYR